jgi:tRNA pseudouridine55 synthase
MNKKYKQAVIFGTFDIIHPGHISVFKYAKIQAQKLTVIVARDQNVNKDSHLFFQEKQRLSYLKKYDIIDQVILGNLKNPLAFYKKINPDVVILGYDQFKNVELLKNIPELKILRAPEFKTELFKSTKLKKIARDKNAGFYLINKSLGKSSFFSIVQLRKILGLKKVGFAGTLDPRADGLLILASGKATKFLDAFHYLNKVYQAEIELGKTSTTYDLEGEITIKKVTHKPTKKEIKELIQKKFSGTILQTPPIFSAKQVNGKRLYELARKGEKVKIPKQKIDINNIEILNYKYPFLTLRIDCSKGTYIRSIAHDLGKKLKTGGMLTKLTRTDIGPFKLKNALSQKSLNLEKLTAKRLNILKTTHQINKYFLEK